MSTKSPLTEQQKRRIAGRARTLHERLESPFPAEGTGDDIDVDQVMDDWRESVADGDEELFWSRLDQLGLDKDDCRRRLQVDRWPVDEPLPAWIDWIEDLSAYLSTIEIDDLEISESKATKIPFAEFVVAVIDYASGHVEWERASDYISPEGIRDFEAMLTDQVETLCSHSLFLEFKSMIAEHDRELAFADDPPMPDDPRRYYDEFVADLFDGGFVDLISEYSFLARLLSTVIDQWVTFTEEFLTRLAADRSPLSETFADGSNLGTVTDLVVLGDRHNEGRTTLGVTFSSGTRLAYKPRDTEIAACFSDLVSWLNDRSTEFDLRTPQVVTGKGYGWMEWIDNEPCSSPDATERYYCRVGSLIGLLYVLRYSDGHLENLIAEGEYPVPIDLETLAKPGMPDVVDTDSVHVFHDGTVLETGLLPETRGNIDDESSAADSPTVGGFGRAEVTWTGLQIPEFIDINTDVMDLVYRTDRTMEGKNMPIFDGDVVEPDSYANEIVRGFESTYRCLRAHREELLEEDGPLAAFQSVEIRYVAKPSDWYGKILRSVERPSYLRTGIDFGCRTEHLARTLVIDNLREVSPAVFEAEREALTRRDVPRFSTRIDSRDIWLNGTTVDESFFSETAFSKLRERIRGLSEADLEKQLDYLEITFCGRLEHRNQPLEDVRIRTTGDDTIDPDDLDFRQYAIDVFDRLVDNAIALPSGERFWVQWRSGNIGFKQQVIEDNLYDGRVGVALFGAALYHTFGESRYRDFVDETIAPLVDSDLTDHSHENRPVGMAGDGSIVYGLTKLAELLEDETYLEAALDMARGMTPDRLRNDRMHDVMQGNAGAILGLLALYEATGDDEVVERAQIAGDHLLESSENAGNASVWTSTLAENPQNPLQGFAHGTAGIAYSFGRLADVTDDDRYTTAVLESLAFEHELYDPDHKNWRDQRVDGEAFPVSWCYGRSGIGLSRLGLASICTDDHVGRDIDNAVTGTDPTTLDSIDHVCCGNFGRVEWLREAAIHLDSEQPRRDARRLAAATITRAETESDGVFRGPYLNERLYDPAFFSGEAGIGYSLLRLEDPSLPCVLLFE